MSSGYCENWRKNIDPMYNSGSAKKEEPQHTSCQSEIQFSPRLSRFEEYLQSFKILCVSDLNPKVGDKKIIKILYKEYTGFGHFVVRICFKEERVAYIYFRTSKDAEYAIRYKSVVRVQDQIANVTPIRYILEHTDL